MNEADEAESSKALAFTVEPSGALTRTMQVIISGFHNRLVAAFDEMTGTLTLVLGWIGAGLLEVGVLSM